MLLGFASGDAGDAKGDGVIGVVRENLVGEPASFLVPEFVEECSCLLEQCSSGWRYRDGRAKHKWRRLRSPQVATRGHVMEYLSLVIGSGKRRTWEKCVVADYSNQGR